MEKYLKKLKFIKKKISINFSKTTQVPQYILEHYLESQRGAYCNIIVTQPRRISAVSVAERVAYERNEDLRQTSGYSVRFESALPRPYAGILFCTVGVLLRKLENGLRGVSHVVIDEIHERDIDTDFLLVLMCDMLRVNSELKVVLMSATIDTTLFAEYFNSCPIVEVFGRTYPIAEYFLEDTVQILDFVPSAESRKRKNKSGNEDEEEEDDELVDEVAVNDEEGANADVTGNQTSTADVDCNTIVSDDYSEKTKNAMRRLSEKVISFELIECLLRYIVSLEQPGGILIFLPGWNLIVMLLKFLRESAMFGNSQRFIILPLHSQIPREDQ